MSSSPASPRLEPVAKPRSSFWNEEKRALDEVRTTADLPVTVDVAIIGGGYSGVSMAYHLLEHELAPDNVLVLEARQISSGATGRNGGHIKPEMYYSLAKYAKAYGMEAAAELSAFEVAHVYALKELIEKEGIDCDFQLTRAIDVFLDAGHFAKTEAAFHELVEAGLATLRDVAVVGKQHAEWISGFKDAKGAFTFTAASVWPLKLVQGILQRIIDKHGDRINVQTSTPVQSVSQERDKHGMWTVYTSRGEVRARRVVYATNAYTAGVLPEYKDRIVPVRGMCSRILPGMEVVPPHINNTMAIRFNERHYDYLVPRPDGSIIVGGGGSTFWHSQEAWFGNHDDGEIVGLAKNYFNDYMQRHFYGWDNTFAYPDNVWTGIMGYSADWMPHVGLVPKKPGQYIIAGFTGHGMPQIFLSAKGLAGMVLAGDAFADAGIPRLFEATEERMLSKESPLREYYQTFWASKDLPIRGKNSTA
ncbi:hypothetical protein RB594_006889 [Gaeumannomyces avenae]